MQYDEIAARHSPRFMAHGKHLHVRFRAVIVKLFRVPRHVQIPRPEISR
jgi:hypothetical protein